jgi:hypothetical protein
VLNSLGKTQSAPDPPLSVHAFTLAVIVNIVAVAQKKYMNSLGLWAVLPLALLFFTGLYLFGVNRPPYEGKTLIVVNVTNYGDRPTTITCVSYFYFKGRRFLRKKHPDKSAFAPNLNLAQPLPFELRPGVLWAGIDIQTPQIEEWATTGIFDMNALPLSHQQAAATACCHQEEKRCTNIKSATMY